MVWELHIREQVPLAPLCSLNLGGRARYFVTVENEPDLVEALAWAEARKLSVAVLSGGTNVVISDDGYDGLVIQLALRGVSIESDGAAAWVTVRAGEPWDLLVERTVRECLAGIECLSGIPGLAGGAVVQNAGAYGQEISDAIVSVRLFDRNTHAIRELSRSACDFRYRDSSFKRCPPWAVVTAVTFALQSQGVPTVQYGELERALAPRRARDVSLIEVREAVLALRQSKGMLLSDSGENRFSVGSFFTNPVVGQDTSDKLVRYALEEGLVTAPEQVPRFMTGDSQVKLAAAWLIERAGFTKGFCSGHVGLSSQHALALVHHGGGTSAELVAFAQKVRDSVRERFAITLTPEPVFIGFSQPPL
jgi:UDP-N-acetylmuramate dehydrogenase